MASDTERLDKILALLAKAENEGATPEERETFMAGAHRLMAKWEIDEAELAAAKSPEERWSFKSAIIAIGGKYQIQKAEFLYRVAVAMGCKAIIITHGKSHRSVSVMGTDEDVTRIKILMTSLAVQMEGEMLNAGGTSKAFRINFIDAYATAVVKKITEAREAARRSAEWEERFEAAAAQREGRDTGPSVALVLANKVERLEDAFQDEWGDRMQDKAPRRRPGSTEGLDEGWLAGQRADVGTSKAVG